MKFKGIIAVIMLLTCYTPVYTQTVSRAEQIRMHLDNLTDEVPQLLHKVSFSVSGVSLYEFLRALGNNNKINLDIEPQVNTTIAVNFSSVSIIDLLVYLSEQYNLDIYNTGNILSVVKYSPIPEVPPLPPPKVFTTSYNSQSRHLSYDLHADTLSLVLKRISEISDVNVIYPQALRNRTVSGFINNMQIDDALQELALSNNLSFRVKDSATFYIEEPDAKPLHTNNKKHLLPAGLELVTNHKDSILSIRADNTPIKDILAAVAKQFEINYFIFSELKGTSDLKADYIDFNTFLKYLFNATDFTYRYDNGVYLIGDRKLEEIRSTEVYPLKYRTVNKLIEQIPAELKKGLEVISYPELNSLIMAGSGPALNQLKSFIRQVDKIVPVINIELIILDIRKSKNVSTGIMAGIDAQKTTSSYSSVFPTLDITLSANSINSIIDGINGTGIVNLGKVTPGFYVSLKASEDNGFLKIRSTPKLSTLNGNEAEMTIGETRYYAEQTTNVITTQSTTTVNARIFKELQANFSVIIKPVVSGDEQITLDISVEQSTFTEQFTKDGPYGRLTRSFKSSVRVRNNEIILLGGLEEKNSNDAGQGVPLLSRVPVLKWLFSSRSNSNKKSKLALLIHPTVFY